MTTADTIRLNLDLAHIHDGARWAANQLRRDRHSDPTSSVVVAHITPGDMTCYTFIVCSPHTPQWGAGPKVCDPYHVTLTLGDSYPWRGKPTLSPEYAASKWGGRNGNLWTGVVVAEFLNQLALELVR